MKKQKQQKGMLLLCTLVIMIILSIFLIAGVYHVQSSTMVTKRAIWEIKSYWGARAGNTLAADGCLRSVKWPNSECLDTAGGYTITKDNETDAVKGSSNTDCNFSIYYKNKLLSTQNILSHSPSESNFSDNFNNVNMANQGEIYCLTAGHSGPSTVGLELLYHCKYIGNFVNDSNTFNQKTMTQPESISASAAAYSIGSMDITVTNQVHIKNSGSDNTADTRPSIISKGVIKINGAGEANEYSSGPLDMAEGVIFAEKLILNNTQEILPTNTNSNLVNYNINVFPPNGVEIDKSKIQGVRTTDTTTVPSGTFCFIEIPKRYTYNEFKLTVDGLMGSYLDPAQFYDVYFNEIAGDAIEDFFNSLGNLIFGSSEEDPDYIDTNDGINFNNSILSGDGEDYFQTKFSDKFNTGFSEMQEGKSILGNIALSFNENKFRESYRRYLRTRINNSITKYRNTTDVSNYEPMFIPDGYAGIDEIKEFENIYLDDMVTLKDNLKLNFETFTNARIYSDLSDELKTINEGEGGSHSGSNLIVAFLQGTGIFENEEAKRQSEIQHIRNNLQNLKWDDIFSSDDIYIVEKLPDSNLNVLHKMSEYNASTTSFSQHNEFKTNANILQKISFENGDNSLKMKIDGNIKTNGFFNFATFERNTSLNKYRQATHKRSEVQLKELGDGSIMANDSIAIKGVINGNGHLISQHGNISFEVGSGIDAGAENKVAVIAKNGDIKLLRNSATFSAEAHDNDAISSFKGVFFCDNLKINARQCSEFHLEGIIISNGIIVKNLDDLFIDYNPTVSAIVLSSLEGWNTSVTDYTSIETQIANSSNDDGRKEYITTGTFKFINRI